MKTYKTIIHAVFAILLANFAAPEFQNANHFSPEKLTCGTDIEKETG